MLRRHFLSQLVIGPTIASCLVAIGCRGKQVAHVLKDEDEDMVGSHAAGAETWKPLIEESVGKLLARNCSEIHTASLSGDGEPEKKRVCFMGVENKSAEEIGDSREQIYELIDSLISSSEQFQLINKRFVEAGLDECGLRGDDLFVPAKRRMFMEAMENAGQPINYLLYAKITSLSTKSNGDSQRDYQLVLELINTENGNADKESATIRKGYHKSKLSKLKHY